MVFPLGLSFKVEEVILKLRCSPNINNGLTGFWKLCRVQLTLKPSRARPGWVLNRQVQEEFRFRERLRQRRGAHVQKATELSRATKTKAIPAGLATSLLHL